jgi:hypothetical protein
VRSARSFPLKPRNRFSTQIHANSHIADKAIVSLNAVARLEKSKEDDTGKTQLGIVGLSGTDRDADGPAHRITHVVAK